ncbi:putative protein PHYTOCHROME KINASE SUBSTRATE [Helianthus annuus]|nr:putative protein PHYTOCHROME KINASE SUBSTRATE [Helianthus annuus]KAJ0754999.1 putative protein PHYTOCHROME KINASE SUBSTRATE [Helianthus annuus]
MGTENNLTDLRVASFSCYLKPIEGVANMFDHHPSHENFKDMSVMDLHRVKPSIFTARTPSIASEASSWNNSQGALLQRKPPSSGGKRWFYGCTGPCYTRKSVYVQQSIKKGDQFAFPVINPTMDILSSKKENVEELPRMSIEVFGSGTINNGDIAKNLVRKMSILTWDAIPKSKESVICDDMASEASSDLFEIENISRSGWQPSESSCMSPSTQYAPSEASIEWSVVTASAADYSSVYSGYDEKNSVYNTSGKNKIERPKKTQRKLDNGLLGCKNFKSVKVVESVKSKY